MSVKSEEQTEQFLLLFPIPQRVILLVLVGLWLWQWQLVLLSKKIDITRIILTMDPYDIHPQPSKAKLVQSTKSCVTTITKIILPWHILTVFLLSQATQDKYGTSVWLVGLINISPLLQLITIGALLFSSSTMLQRCFKNIICLGNIEPKPLRTNYILISDTLTSYGKPMIDYGLYLCQLLTNPVGTDCIIRKDPLGISLNLDLMIGITPATIRLIQCLREYKRSTSSADARAALFNALKYSCQFPILVYTVVTRAYPGETPSANIYWLLLLNSMYTFWWDLTMDWKFGFFNFTNSGMKLNEVSRAQRHFSIKTCYCAIFVDFILRFAWLWELVSGVSVFKGEMNVFWLQFLEIVRRWIWIFFKVEAEYLSLQGAFTEKAQD